MTKNLSWKYLPGVKVTPELKKNILWFEGALADEKSGLPLYGERFKIPAGYNSSEAMLTDVVYQEMDVNIFTEISAQLMVLDQPLVRSEIMVESKVPYVAVTVNPFRKNPVSGKFETLSSFKISFVNSMSSKAGQKSWSYPAHSVLATGDWYKLGVSFDGIYKLTYTDLIAMGIAVDQIDPRNIAVFGQGGRPLPENNAVSRDNDLVENAIYISGESDGRFDATDFILFYGVGTTTWNYVSAQTRFQHILNKYSKQGFYFLTVRSTPGKRVALQNSLSQSADYFCDRYQAYTCHELDSLNLIKSGREFYGEVFDIETNHEFSFDLHDPVPGTNVSILSSAIARSFNCLNQSNFDIYVNGTKRETQYVPCVTDYYAATYAAQSDSIFYAPATTPLTVKYSYNKMGSATAMGWLNYINLNYTAYLNFSGRQFSFRDGLTIGKGVTEFSMTNAAGVTVWNVTDPQNVTQVQGTLAGTNLLFRLRTDSLMGFVAHNEGSYYTPQNEGKVANQDLHGFGQYDMVIISPPEFQSYAATLAEFHRNNDALEVVVVSPEQVYNEFSSGAQDPTAIRSLMKMLYDRAGWVADKMPQYLLLLGDGSYDNLDRLPDNTDYIVTWETPSSLSPSSSYTTDDYFAFLDDSEYGATGGLMDIAVGRLPVKSVEEAAAVVDKILRYGSKTDLISTEGACSGFNSQISNFADWRNVLCFVADDTDVAGENFLGESEYITDKIDTMRPEYNIDKIYFDAYPQESTPGGQRYPDVNDLINKRVAKGALVINYIGHGGETGWAHEVVLDVSTINGWENKYNLPLFVTATCEFSRYDDPERTSAGEYVLINPNGGGIALFTTTRLAYTGSNAVLNTLFYSHILDKSSGDFPTMGNAVRNSKNAMLCNTAVANFCLLGDPAVRLAYPQNNVVTTSINYHPAGSVEDTLRALAKVTIGGEVRDVLGNKLTDYNGIIYPAVFDKRATITSLGNDAGSPRNFTLQKNIIYKGKSTVTSGDFTFSFLVPKDIAYQYGKGKISYYVTNGSVDGNGYFNDFLIGGTENMTITDREGPQIDLFLNDEKFVSGGLTDPDPFLFAKISDSAGVNTVGNGIGHDISAVLDNNTDKTIVLNDYYESDLNTYQSGSVRYPFDGLEVGSHILSLKVWDVYNNSGEKNIDFVVADNADLALDHVLNYPNPFTTYTEFWFEHNQPCCGLDVQIQIFTVTGKLIKTINTWVQTSGYRADPIPWDGLDDYGDPIGKGVYIYKLKVRDNNGNDAETLEKLVILR